MPREPRGLFLLLRGLADLERASRELTACRSAPHPASPECAREVIQGIWVDEKAVANLPFALTLPEEGGGFRHVRVPETTGVNGIWMLCWLDAPARTVSRADLVAALLGGFGGEAVEAAPLAARFVPVFPGDMPQGRAEDDVRMLQRRYPGRVLSPLHLDDDGTLRLPPAYSHGGGAP
ncbi:MAG: hypothetical protein KY442_10785 [Proteobacteria bacterium]|nr:hypothetical protein [Pseudomonadota bacterium]